MTPDVFEDELRTLLHGATDAQSSAFTDVDTDAVLHTGHRIVRRRRIAMVGGTAAAALVVAAGTWAAVGGSADRAAPIPAERTTMADVGTVGATLPQDPGSTVDEAVYSVQLDTATGRVFGTVRSGDAAEQKELGRVSRTGGTSVWQTVSEDPFVVLGIVPTAATSLITTTQGDLGGVTDQEAPLAGTPYKAILVRSEKSPEDAAVVGLDWTDRRGVYTATGATVPSVAVDGRLVYLDVAGDLFGIVDRDGNVSAPVADYRDKGLPPQISTGYGDSANGPMTMTVAMVLPAGATDVDLTAAPGATLEVGPTTAALPRGAGTVVLATLEQPAGTRASAASAVSWTEGGVAHTVSTPPFLELPGSKDGFGVDALTSSGETTAFLTRIDGGDLEPAEVELRSQDMTGDDGLVRGCSVDGRTVCALLPAYPEGLTLRDASGRALGLSWTTARLEGTDRHVVVARSTTRIAGLEWSEAGNVEHGPLAVGG